MAQPDATKRDSGASGAQQVLGLFVLLALAGLVAFVTVEAFPHHVKNATNPNFVDNIVANSVVIFAIRLALLFGVVYVGVSVVVASRQPGELKLRA